MLAPKSSAGRTLPAEHCRYGAIDLSPTKFVLSVVAAVGVELHDDETGVWLCPVLRKVRFCSTSVNAGVRKGSEL